MNSINVNLQIENIDFEIQNRVAHITINNAPANALNAKTINGLSECIEYIANNKEVKAVIITGAGKFFVAGADIKEFDECFQNAPKGELAAKKAQELFNRIEALDKPVIAAINGACLGGGLELAMSCHIRIAANEALLGLPELKLGLIPGFGGTQRLPRLTNKAIALELILTSEFINGQQAEKIGLVNHSVARDELMIETVKLAEKIAAEKSAVSIAAALDAVNRGLETTLQEGLDIEAKHFGEMFESADAEEGITAFVEKRAAQFKDR